MKLDSVYPRSLKTRSSSIEKIQQCWVEDGEEGCGGRCPRATRADPPGGLVLAGVAVASSCQVVLPIFGSLFLIVGAVLTIASYRGPEIGEDHEQYMDRVNLTSNLRVLGPCCLAVGAVMLTLGITLCLLSRRANRHKMPYHCPIHGDFYPISPVNVNRPFESRSSMGWCRGREDVETPQCPHSTRSSVSHQSPSPRPPVNMPSHSQSFSFSGGTLMPGPFMASGETIGSIRSLSVSYDVASFPHSRSPTPTSELEEDPKQSRKCSLVQ